MKLEIHADVQRALAAQRGVVALESTIITHGMPYPENIDTARQVEADVRADGAVPATIAVLDGCVKVGLTDTELEHLARAGAVMKLSRADLPMALATERTGSTTVAATMILAELAGIRLFATGGIGGVHRGGPSSFDVSADLSELSRTDVTVVCAGAKAILDIPLTLEYLETLGVPLIVYGSDEVPAFWSCSSGSPAPMRCDTSAAIVRFIEMREELRLQGGVLVANPIPPDDEIPQKVVEQWISVALTDASEQRITGKAVTPYLLARINELSQGRSLKSNIALVRNNARLAARVAVLLAARPGPDKTGFTPRKS